MIARRVRLVRKQLSIALRLRLALAGLDSSVSSFRSLCAFGLSSRAALDANLPLLALRLRLALAGLGLALHAFCLIAGNERVDYLIHISVKESVELVYRKTYSMVCNAPLREIVSANTF